VCAAYAKRHVRERDQFLIEWGAAEEAAMNIPAAKLIERRLENERSRREGRIIGFTLGKTKGGGVQTALRDTPDGPQECTTKTDTEQAFLTESLARFRQADDTPALTALYPYLGRFGLTEDAERILSGTFNPPDTIDFWTKEWLKELARPPNYIPMEVTRTQEDHTYGWKRAYIVESLWTPFCTLHGSHQRPTTVRD
jgi:hypothetical protein